MPPPSCIVRRWAMSEPRKTRLEISDRYSSFFRKSESNKGMGQQGIGFGLQPYIIMLRSSGQSRFAHAFEDIADDRIGLQALGLPLEVKNQAMAKGGRGDGADIFAGHVIAIVEDGPQFGGQDDRLGATRAAAVADI